ncbi:carbohydrate ABC transporter membrane protein 2, CUT1 family [Lachnospiraceae bacterium KH1T2]|nr:carbohydrate ABC transporter membrane protein 2, CUT1 family [Lachnospiraceae bacterium KH1T2]
MTVKNVGENVNGIKTSLSPEQKALSKSKHTAMVNNIITVVLGVVALFYVYPIFMIVINSLKQESAISTNTAFDLPTSATFAGMANYIHGVTQMDFLSSFGYSLFITVSSVILIILCCSMCAWYISRVDSVLSKVMYYLCIFSMVVPFQMVMFTLAKTADTLKLNNPFNICIIYLGFGAGLAVFMFTGFMKSMPIEIEEAAMIDGYSPLQMFFKVVLPITKPTTISTAILETMWVWNDYLLPTLVLDIKKYRTIPMDIQYFRGSYGSVQMAPMMACIVITIIPVILLYLFCQKYIIEGVVAGAVKG